MVIGTYLSGQIDPVTMQVTVLFKFRSNCYLWEIAMPRKNYMPHYSTPLFYSIIHMDFLRHLFMIHDALLWSDSRDAFLDIKVGEKEF